MVRRINKEIEINDSKAIIKSIRVLGKQMGFWKYGYGYAKRCKQVFGKTELRGTRVLEIGCGKGLFCIWASFQGAEHVIGLEPLADGSVESEKCYNDFKFITATLNLTNIEMLPYRLQEYKTT